MHKQYSTKILKLTFVLNSTINHIKYFIKKSRLLCHFEIVILIKMLIYTGNNFIINICEIKIQMKRIIQTLYLIKVKGNNYEQCGHEKVIVWYTYIYNFFVHFNLLVLLFRRKQDSIMPYKRLQSNNGSQSSWRGSRKVGNTLVLLLVLMASLDCACLSP